MDITCHLVSYGKSHLSCIHMALSGAYGCSILKSLNKV